MNVISHRRECRRTARDLMAFLDRDPSARLSATDQERIRTHLEACRKCASVAAEYKVLHEELRFLGESVEIPPESVRRVKEAVRRTLQQDDSDQ